MSQKLVEELAVPKIPLHFFNTETRHKEIFKPYFDNNVKMYTCGPTVYHYAHIGNFRTYVFEDLLRRTLKFFGFQVTQVMNLTDIDDKTIQGSREKNVTLSEYTQPYKNAFFVDLQLLGIERAEHYPAATDYIPHMIDFIQALIDKGIAYKSKDGSVYYSIQQFNRYGCLSHLKFGELQAGAGDARVACDEYDKENVGDFVLWKGYDPKRDGLIYWKSPFGPGRPGWHLECSTMAMQLLGETLDIHVGGVDNIFPHHENEIAQSEALSGKPLARYWMHSEHLLVNQKKMSKSLGNFYTLRDLLDKGYQGMEVRYMLLHTHYRIQLNFTFEGLDSTKTALQRINDFILRMQEMADSKDQVNDTVLLILKKRLYAFSHALADDLNISVALAEIFDMMKELNILYDENTLTRGDANAILYLMHMFNRVLGIFTFKNEESIPQDFLDLLEKRNQARREKNWKLADSLRDEIHKNGYEIEDTSRGPRLKKR